jgi:hypothetical protein
MSTLTHLSDAELDAVTGGFLNSVFGNLIVQRNVSITAQSQNNSSVLPIVAAVGMGGSQSSSTSQGNNVSVS